MKTRIESPVDEMSFEKTSEKQFPIKIGAINSQSTTENTYRRTISFSIFSTTARGWPEDARDLLLVWRYSFCSHVVKKSWWKTANQLQKCRFCDHQYLIQPQASQINVRHVGSRTYGNFSLLRRMSKINGDYRQISHEISLRYFRHSQFY